MPIILGIDIGIKNLSLCIYDTNNKRICYWDVINVIPVTPVTPVTPVADSKILTNNCSNLGCKFKGKYKLFYNSEETFFCTRHAKKHDSFLDMTEIHIFKDKVKNYTNQQLAFFTITKLNQLFSNLNNVFNSVNLIRIELQPKFNPKMKLISHVIYTKLIEYYQNKVKVSFITAKNKMKIIFSDKNFSLSKLGSEFKNTYAQRKKISINYVNFYLMNSDIVNSKEYLNIIADSEKKDDLCDAFLLCI